MKRLIIDMDDVMADTTGQFITFYEKEFGVKIDRNALHGKDECLGFPDHHDIIRKFPYRENFFRTITVMEGCQTILEALNKKYDLFIVSAAIQFPLSLHEKLLWLEEHFPFLHWKQIVFCGSKAVVHGDYMIDDYTFNLEHFNGEKFMFTAPHNIFLNQYQRLNSWKEVGERFL